LQLSSYTLAACKYFASGEYQEQEADHGKDLVEISGQ